MLIWPGAGILPTLDKITCLGGVLLAYRSVSGAVIGTSIMLGTGRASG